MKQVSTVASAQSRNISPQKLTIGLDLGDRNSWYCVVDEAGRYKGNSESGRMRKNDHASRTDVRSQAPASEQRCGDPSFATNWRVAF